MNNPYQSPQKPEPRETLAALERKALVDWMNYRDQPRSLFAEVKRCLPVWGLQLVLFSLLIAVFGILIETSSSTILRLAPFLVGMLLGSYLRDYAYIKRKVRFWPLVNRSLDWEAISKQLHDA